MKKILMISLSLIAVLCFACFFACSGDNKGETNNGEMYSVYAVYKAYAEENGETPLTYEQWLKSIKGEKGDAGKDGVNGKSAYEIWLSNGNTGNEADFLTWLEGKDGVNGKSAYEIWLSNGNTGNEADFLTWLKGKDGENGIGIESVTIDENGELIITLTNGDKINAGKVKEVHGHEIVEKEVIERESTCTKAGIKYVFCETCGELLRTVVTDLKPHDYNAVVTEPTCTEQGYTTHTCKDCGHIEIGTYTDALGHGYKKEYVFDDNYHWQETTCGHEDAIIKAAHTYEDDVCTICGYDNRVTLALKYVEINGGTEYAVDELTDETVKTVYIPDEYNGKPVTKINDMVFYRNTTIEKVVMGDNITDIGASAFYCCYNLKKVKLSSELEEMKSNAFYNCYSLTEITIPDSVTSIGEYAFAGCGSLTSVTIPDSVTSIGAYAFYYCSSLTEVTIPDSVTNIGNSAFYYCNNLTHIYYIGTASQWVSIDGLLNIMSSSRALYINNEPVKDIVLEGITEIKPSAFYYSSLTSVTIPNSVTSIGEGAFAGCGSLTSVTIPDSVTSIGVNAFAGCGSLTEVTIPDSVKRIGRYAFNGCPCEKTSKGVSFVDKWLVSCVTEVTKVTIKEDTVGIADSAFSNCSSLTSITIPDSITSIGNDAFYSCNSLKSIYYTGTEGDWNKITKRYYDGSGRYLGIYYYSEVEPELNESGTAYNGNYWHYVDGEVVVWTKEN